MMEHNTQHEQKDIPEDRHKTAVRKVEDMVTDPTEPHHNQRAVKTRDAEVRDVQYRESKQICNFSGQGEEYQVLRGVDFINTKKIS